LHIIETFPSVFQTRVRNRLLPPTSLQQLEDVQEEWYKIMLETIQNLYKSSPWVVAVWKAKDGMVNAVFLLFCPIYAQAYILNHTCFFGLDQGCCNALLTPANAISCC
jgi:hypothetical protein